MIQLIPLLCSALALRKLSTRAIWLLVGICLVVLVATYQNAWWGLYHYQLGSKYFRELGYFDLYECTLDALDLQTVRRDLRDYTFRFDPPDCEASFTPERWAAFQADLNQGKRVFDPNMIVDKGLNATPTWVALGEHLSTLPRAFLTLLDPLTLCIALFVAGRLLGWRKAGYAALFIVTYYGTITRLLGHLGQWWWLAAVILGVALLEKRKAWGGFWLGLAITLAIFPMFLLLGRSRRVLRFAAMGLAVGLLIGLSTSRGLEAYPQFLQNMMLHSQHIRYEPFNVGLFNTLSMAESPQSLGDWLECFRGGSCQVDYTFASPWLGWLLLLPLVLNSRLGAMFGLLTLSRYYYLVVVSSILEEREWRIRLLFGVNTVISVMVLLNRETAYQWGHFLWVAYFGSYWLDRVNLSRLGRYLTNPTKQIVKRTLL